LATFLIFNDKLYNISDSTNQGLHELNNSNIRPEDSFGFNNEQTKNTRKSLWLHFSLFWSRQSCPCFTGYISHREIH